LFLSLFFLVQVMALTSGVSLSEIVPDAISFSKIDMSRFASWLSEQNRDQLPQAKLNFLQSVAADCVVSFVLGNCTACKLLLFSLSLALTQNLLKTWEDVHHESQESQDRASSFLFTIAHPLLDEEKRHC
jgi:hypothetical protein